MFDPRDNTRERGDDGRARAYEGPDRTGDPRDVFLRDVDLPLEREREYVLARDHVYELNGEESRTLATLGAFRVVPERDLVEGGDAQDVNDALDHLRQQGLIESVPISDHDQGLVLTDRGHDLLEANHRDRDSDEDPQAFHAGVSRLRELAHDASLYGAYRAEEARLRQEHEGAEIRRVVLDGDLKREYQSFLQDRNRDRPDSDGRPDRDAAEIAQWAQQHDLPYFDDTVHFPDVRIEYEVDGRVRHEDLEVLTPHYRGAHLAGRPRPSGGAHRGGRARGGSRCSSAGASRRRGGGFGPRLAEDLLA